MLKKTITYTDFNGDSRTEDFYFNLSKAELINLDLEMPGGLDAYAKKIIRDGNRSEIVKLFKRIILGSYGEKDDTGRRFIKTKEMTDAFEQTNAFSELYMELLSDENNMVAFVNGVIPKVEDSDKPVEAKTVTMP